MASTNFTYTPTTGPLNNTQVTASTRTNNTSTATKSALITLSNGEKTTQLRVRQLYRPYFTMTSNADFPATGGTATFVVHTEYDVVFFNIPSWIVLKRGSSVITSGTKVTKANADGATFTLTASENTGNTRSDNSMSMGHYINNVIQAYDQKFSLSQEASNAYTPLTFDITSGGSINFLRKRTNESSMADVTIQYRKNNGSWTNLTSSTGGTTFYCSTGDVIQFRGSNQSYGLSDVSYITFSGSSATFTTRGNLMSLVNPNTFYSITQVPMWYQFTRLFAGTKITSAEMLVMSPTYVAEHAYESMFEGCTGLTKSPELPAPTLTPYCYQSMFRGCTRLNHVRCYATNIQASGCTTNWFQSVASSGTFVKNLKMSSWPSGVSGAPTTWTKSNYSLPRDMVITPVYTTASSGQVQTTLTVTTTGCSWSGFTYTYTMFQVDAVKVNNTLSLTFTANPGEERNTRLIFDFVDTSGNVYTRIAELIQQAAPNEKWYIQNDCQFSIGLTVVGDGYSFYQEIAAGADATRAGDEFPLTITSLSLAPGSSQSPALVFIGRNERTSANIQMNYNSGNDDWEGTGSIQIQNGDILTIAPDDK